jgi:hypothetical protein
MIQSQLPGVVDGARLTWDVSVVVPVARTNIAKNPSLETGSTGWAAAGAGSVARDTTKGYFGAYGLAVIPTATTGTGAYYDDTTAFVNGTTYAVSISLLGVPGQAYEISVRTTAGVSLRSEPYIASGYWERIWLPYLESTGANRRVYVTKVGTQTGVFYLDGLDIQPCGSEGVFDTTHIDGDQFGLMPNEAPPAYGWNGTPHASTSYRIGQTRAGGRLVPFSDYGFTLSSIVGLGLDTPQHDILDFSILDGAQYRDSRKPQQTFTLVGRFDGGDLGELSRNRGGLGALLDRDLLGRHQPLIVQFQPRDDDGNVIGETGRTTALYTGGLPGSMTNAFAESVAISFLALQPTIIGGESGMALSGYTTLTADYAVQMNATTNVWARMGSGATFNGAIRAWAVGTDGSIYAAGDFTTTAGGVAANRIAKWNGSAWSALGTGANGIVRALAVGPNGTLYAGGDFTLMGGVANTSRIAKWDGSVWTPMGTGAAANEVYAIAATSFYNYVVVGGTFTTIGGVAANRIAVWNGSTWAAIGTGANNTVHSLVILSDGITAVAGGDFTGMGGVTGADRIAKATAFSTWTALSTGMNSTVRALAVGLDQTIYAGGDFTTAGGVTCTRLASWNGNIWEPLSSGADASVYALSIAPDTGWLWVGGAFQIASATSIGFYRLLIWNGSAWIIPSMYIDTDYVLSLLTQRNGAVAFGTNAIAGARNSASGNTVTNRGSAATYPRLIIYNGSSYYSLLNATTARRMSWLDLTFSPEYLAIDFDPTRLITLSTVRGLLPDGSFPGSDVTTMYLQPGDNQLAVSVLNNSYLVWALRYLSLDDLIPRLP